MAVYHANCLVKAVNCSCKYMLYLYQCNQHCQWMSLKYNTVNTILYTELFELISANQKCQRCHPTVFLLNKHMAYH